MLKQTIKTALTSQSNRERLIVPICEFSFVAYSVQIKQDFRCLPEVPGSQTKSRHLQRTGVIRRISQWLRRACPKPTAALVSKPSILPVSKIGQALGRADTSGFGNLETTINR